MFVRSLTRRIRTWQLFIQQRMPLRIERLWSRRPTEHVFYYVKIRSSTFFLFLHCYFKRHAQACNSGINFTVGNITLAKHLTNRAEIWATKQEWLLFAKNNNYIAPRIDVCSHSSALAGFNVFSKWHWEY